METCIPQSVACSQHFHILLDAFLQMPCVNFPRNFSFEIKMCGSVLCGCMPGNQPAPPRPPPCSHSRPSPYPTPICTCRRLLLPLGPACLVRLPGALLWPRHAGLPKRHPRALAVAPQPGHLLQRDRQLLHRQGQQLHQAAGGHSSPGALLAGPPLNSTQPIKP